MVDVERDEDAKYEATLRLRDGWLFGRRVPLPFPLGKEVIVVVVVLRERIV